MRYWISNKSNRGFNHQLSHTDITLKEIANTSINELLEFMNIDYEIVESAKTEFQA